MVGTQLIVGTQHQIVTPRPHTAFSCRCTCKPALLPAGNGGPAPFTLNLDALTATYWAAGTALAKNIGEVRELILREVAAGRTVPVKFRGEREPGSAGRRRRIVCR